MLGKGGGNARWTARRVRCLAYKALSPEVDSGARKIQLHAGVRYALIRELMKEGSLACGARRIVQLTHGQAPSRRLGRGRGDFALLSRWGVRARSLTFKTSPSPRFKVQSPILSAAKFKAGNGIFWCNREKRMKRVVKKPEKEGSAPFCCKAAPVLQSCCSTGALNHLMAVSHV